MTDLDHTHALLGAECLCTLKFEGTNTTMMIFAQAVEFTDTIQDMSEVSSDFDVAGPLTESVLMGNLALRSFDIRKKGSPFVTLNVQ